jgi:hypothetical protein
MAPFNSTKNVKRKIGDIGRNQARNGDMKWSDEEIDNIFQQAEKNASFDYKDDFWTEMEAMLPDKGRRFPLTWFYTSLFFGVLTAIWVLYPSHLEYSESLTSMTMQSEQGLDDKEGKTPANFEGVQDRIQEDESTQTAPGGEDLNYSSENVVLTTVDTQKQDLISSSSPNPGFTNGKLDVVSSNAVTDSKIDLSKKEISATIIASGESSSSVAALNSVEQKATNLVVRNSVTRTDKVQTEADVSDVVQSLSFLGLTVPIIESDLAPFKDYYKPSSTWRLYIDLIGSLGQSPIADLSQGSTHTLGGGFGGGLTYIKGAWRISGGLNFILESYQNLYIRQRSKIYGFGLNVYEHELYYKSFVYLEVPMTVGYTVKKHLFQVGIVPALLDGTSMKYTHLTNGEVDESTLVFGERKGLNSFGLKPTVGYGYTLNNNWILGANVQFQLFSPLQQDVFDGEETSYPLNGQVFIRKTFSFK